MQWVVMACVLASAEPIECDSEKFYRLLVQNKTECTEMANRITEIPNTIAICSKEKFI